MLFRKYFLYMPGKNIIRENNKSRSSTEIAKEMKISTRFNFINNIHELINSH